LSRRRRRRRRRLVKQQRGPGEAPRAGAGVGALDAGADIDATAIVSSSLTWWPVNVDGADLRRGISGELMAQICREMVVNPWRSAQDMGVWKAEVGELWE
jgi:hypothetical protein